MNGLRSSLVVAASTSLLIGVPTVASATPSAGLSDTVLAMGTSPGGIVVGGRGPTDVIVSEITIAPGGSTGWHYHDGELIAIVKSGILTRTLRDCSTVVTPAGGSFAEPAGRDHTHIGRNLSTAPVVLLITYVLPSGQPLSHEVSEPEHCHL